MAAPSIAPQNVVTSATATSITITWDSVPTATGYSFVWDDDPGTLYNSANTTNTTYTFTGLISNRTHYFMLWATNVDGGGPVYGTFSVSTLVANPTISAPINSSTINGGLLQITAGAAYSWRLNGSPITNTPLQNFNYFIKDSGTYTLRATDGSGNFSEVTITVTHNAPTLSTTIPSWFIDGVFLTQQLSFNGLSLPTGTYQVRAEIDNEAGGVASDQHTVTITSSTVLTPTVVEVDSIATGYKVGSLDLNQIFAGRSGLTARANTGFLVRTSTGPDVFTDLSELFASITNKKPSSNLTAPITGIRVGTDDLKALFAPKGSL